MDDLIENIILKNDNILPEFIEALCTQDDFNGEIIPMGIFNRSYKSEIDRYEYIESEHKRYYFTNRTSIYDGLPERLFHQNKISSEGSIVHEDPRDLFIRHRQEETYARDFFYPIDRLLQDLRIQLSRYTFNSVTDNKNNLLCILFDALWDEYEEIVSPHQKLIYMLMITHRAYVLGNATAIQAYLQLFTGEDISVRILSKPSPLKDAITKATYRLGLDFSVGNTYQEMIPFFDVVIGPIQKADTPKFLSGSRMDMAIQFFLRSIMPLESFYSYSFIVRHEPNAFTLSETQTGARLNFTTNLN
ncbi:MAG: hypothetical protein ABI844_07245 [Saprospiraceae bacterium]